ncbi:biliverdin-producing heme oxygenase [Sphingomonas sp. RHCKR7]|uniref:biliverdin-producing heme oxygenase n=1 Tax=Sphingomonas folli TaxID=2862497 RepID=UPI001CA5158A|nr:biliverdin-producing heme oxygenase [Sphingomonas folli]MBW6525947.1 biliverdin-producing heme oxygenase [Sphingomonas folli]
MTTPRPSPDPIPTRTQRLRAATDVAHRRLDESVMALDPFGDRGRYARLLAIHRDFHALVAPLYAAPSLAALIPELAERARLTAVEQDAADLHVPLAPAPAPRFVADVPDRGTALGWLYVAEGSNLGAAILLKAAMMLGLGPSFGARHLAGHADGRARHWRSFTAAVDNVALSPDEEARAVAGAREAFDTVAALVRHHSK